MNVRESNTLSSSVDKKEYVVNHSFNCNDKCIMYLLTCNNFKVQYVGKTVDIFHGIIAKIIIGNVLGKKHACNNTYLSISQMRATVVFLMTFPLPLLMTGPKDSNKLEHYWRHTFKKMAPQGLNVEDD